MPDLLDLITQNAIQRSQQRRALYGSLLEQQVAERMVQQRPLTRLNEALTGQRILESQSQQQHYAGQERRAEMNVAEARLATQKQQAELAAIKEQVMANPNVPLDDIAIQDVRLAQDFDGVEKALAENAKRAEVEPPKMGTIPWYEGEGVPTELRDAHRAKATHIATGSQAKPKTPKQLQQDLSYWTDIVHDPFRSAEERKRAAIQAEIIRRQMAETEKDTAAPIPFVGEQIEFENYERWK